MEVTNEVLLDGNVFLEELRLLRTCKGKYITDSFCTKLEDLSNKMVEVIIQQNCKDKILKLKHSQPSEKISDKMVDLCLECIEIYLQKISSPDALLETQKDQAENVDDNTDDSESSSALQILTHIACDLRALATYIKFTLYVDGRPFPQDTYKDKSELLI